jgi:hypothetical protein
VSRGDERLKQEPVNGAIGIHQRSQVDLPIPPLQQVEIGYEPACQIIGHVQTFLGCPGAQPRGSI